MVDVDMAQRRLFVSVVHSSLLEGLQFFDSNSNSVIAIDPLGYNSISIRCRWSITDQWGAERKHLHSNCHHQDSIWPFVIMGDS